MIRAIQDFEPMKMFTPNEYILLGHPNSRQFVEDPLVQDESNVVEVRIAPPDGFLIKRDPIKMNAMEHTVVRTTSSVSEKISSPTLFISGDLDQEPIIGDNNNICNDNVVSFVSYCLFVTNLRMYMLSYMYELLDTNICAIANKNCYCKTVKILPLYS